ncbi:MAG: hypothetical protein ACI88A_000006 [Paraglaciecola sp.]|jgi:hypothetical protein
MPLVTIEEIFLAEEHQKAAEYNGWVPQANSFFESLFRLDATQNMLGASDPGSLASALLQGLDEAAIVAGRARTNFTSGGPKIDVPEPDASVGALATEVNVAAKQMGVAYLGFQQNLMSERKKLTHADGDTARERMTEIEDVKAFLGNVGKTVDISYSVVSGAPSVMNKASSYVRHGEASLNAARNRKQILAGGRPSHNPTYLATDEQGEMVVRNVQTGTDRNLMTGNSSDMVDPFANVQLPTSAESLLTIIADFVYSEEVKQLTRTLAAVGARELAIQGVIDGIGLKQKAAAFSVAMLDFSVKCADMHRRIVARLI